MTIIDGQVKAALAELAERLPASKDPWSEHARRMAARARTRRRWLTLQAAACLLIVAGVAVPIVLNRSDPAPPSMAQLGPVRIEDFVDGGFDYLGTVERSWNAKGAVTDTLCLLSGLLPRSSAEDVRRDGRCRTTRVADDGPARIHPMATAGCDPDDVDPPGNCPMVTGVIIVTEPGVAQLEVEAVSGRSFTAREVGRTNRVALFGVGLVRSAVQNDINHDRFTYSARDADGQVIDEVTLRGVR